MSTDWLDETLDEAEKQIASISKFKTNRLRKNFFGRLRNLIKNAVHNNTNEKVTTVTGGSNWRADSMHSPLGKKHTPLGHAVMTEALSSRGDDVIGVGPGSENPPAKPPTTAQEKDRTKNSDNKKKVNHHTW